MFELGNLFYNVRLRDLTDQDIQSITQKLRNIGVQADTAALHKSIKDYLDTNPVTVRFNPQITSKEIEDKLTGQVIHAEIHPLTSSLVSSINTALKGSAINIDNLSIDPAVMQAAVRNALAGAGFSGVGDAVADSMEKSIQARLAGKTYPANVEVNVEKLSNSIISSIEKAEKRGIKVDTKGLKSEIETALKSGVKVGIDPQISVAEAEKRLQGKLIKAEIVPLAAKLRSAIQEACKNGGSGVEVQIGPKASLLQRLVTRVLQQQGYMINIDTVTGLGPAIKRALVGNNHVTLTVDPATVVNSLRAAMANMQSSSFGLTVQKDILRNSIDTALAGKPFNIQIAVAHDQARRAVQNALNNARLMGKDDALSYQRLKTGELKAAQAELARLKAAQMGAKSAADAHASASLNLGGAMGSNIKIAGELGAAMSTLYSIHALKNFFSQVVEIGGELEHQKIALETIYGSGSKMESLYGKIKGLARQSPFGVMELTGNIKQLSAYGVAYNEVYDTAKRLADISAATSVDISRLILAFGKTKNRTFLDGLEAKQFAYANIPIYDALSKKLTELEGKFVSVKDVMGRIKKREIGFDMVKDILWEMTDEGGKFYNMQEKLAGSVKTSWKLIKDNIQLMFGEIAESSAGGTLKSLAEILQGLTKDWRTLAAVVGVGTIAFSGYRLAVLANNIVAGKSATVAAKQHAALKMSRYHANLAALSYRHLTDEEARNYLASSGLAKIKGLNALSTKKLTYLEAEALYQKKLLTQQDILRLVALKKVYATTAEQILITKTLTDAEKAEIQTQINRAAAAKRSTVIWMQLKAGMASALGVMRSFIFNPAMLGMAALSAVVALWSKNNEEMEKSKEIGDDIFRKAADGAKELGRALEEIKSPEGMSDLELTQGIEKMEEILKDLSPDAIKDINDALVTQDGHVNSLIERYNSLTGKIADLAAAYQEIRDLDFGSMIEGAFKATDGGNWFTQMFDDDLKTNAKDYTNSLKRRSDAISKFATENRRAMEAWIQSALESDEAFYQAAQGLKTTDAQLRLLVENAEKYPIAMSKFASSISAFENVVTLDKLTNSLQIGKAYDELIADTDKFIAGMNTRLAQNGIDPSNLTDFDKAQLKISLKSVLDSLTEAGDDAKIIIAKKWEQAWNIVLMEDKTGPMIQAKFKSIIADSTDETLKEAVKIVTYEGADKLSEAQKVAWGKAGEAAKKQAMQDLGLTNDEMSKYLEANPLTQLIQLIYTDPQTAPTALAKQLVANHGYPGLTPEIDQYVRQWSKNGTMYGARNAAKESLQEAYSELEAAKKEGGELEKKAKEEYDKIWKTLEYLDWTDIEVKDQKSNKHSGTKSKKDLIAEAFKQRFKDLKDAWAEYQKWQKSIGDMAAADKVADSGLFGDMKAEDIPRTSEQYREAVKKLRSELEAAGIKGHSERETLLNEYIKHILDIDKTIVDENIKKALEVIERAFEKETADFNLYEKIRQATGNEKLAYTFSFGLNGGQTDYIQLVKDHFKNLSDAVAKAAPDAVTYSFDYINEENVTDLPDELQKAWREAVKSISKYKEEQRDMVADILKNYQSTRDKITAIDGERNRKLKALTEDPNLSDVQKQKYSTRVNAEADYEIFRQSGEYLQFFSGIYDLTLSRAQQIGDAIRQHLDLQLQEGTISAKDYYDEIDRINQQLDKLRNVRSNAMTFLTSGVDGLLDKETEINAAKRLKLTQQITELEEKISEAKGKGDTETQKSAEAQLAITRKELEIQDSIRDKIIKNKQLAENILAVSNIASSIAGGMSDAFNTLRDMADSLGFDTDSDTWATTATMLDTLTTVTDGVSKIAQSTLKGDIGGIISGVTSTLLTPITIWSKLHDGRLQRDIEKSQRQFQKWQYIIDSVERRMEHFLGNVRNVRVVDAENDLRELGQIEQRVTSLKSKGKLKLWDLQELQQLNSRRKELQPRIQAYREGGALGYERQLMKEQLSELERQKADMEKMKKKDPQAIADLKDQIDEQRQAILDFAQEMASTVYGIDLSDWASQIGDALVDAFAKGEDAAEAFDKTASSIMRSLASKMISQDIIAPMFSDLRDYLFGADGMSGAYGNDFFLDETEVSAMSDYLSMIRDEGIPRAKELFDAINEATGGLLNDTESADNTVRAGIQALTENTGDLLASYVNGIRGDVSIMANIHWPKLLDQIVADSVIAEAQVQQLRLIAENTYRNMLAAEKIQTSVLSLESVVIQATKSKDKGFYIR